MSETILPRRESQIPKPGNLVTQFMMVSGTVLIAGMLAIGLWVTSEIEEGVTDSAGAVTALYVDALIAPVTQELDDGGSLGDEARRELDFIVRRGALRDEVSAFKLWDPSGRIVFSDNPDLVGSIFDVSDGLAQALAGRVDAALARQSHIVSDIDRNAPLLEVYSPVRSATTGRIIAVAEFYTTAERLREHLFDARVKSWFVVGLVSLGMFSALYALFARGNRTISLQRRALDDQIDQLSALLEQNTGLTQRVEQANHRIADFNERNLRRISAELHDGPVQLLAFAALRLDSPQHSRREQVRQAVNEAMKEIRDICSGLALPEVEVWSVATIVKKVVSAHERRTGRKVVLNLEDDLPELSPAAKTCIYRFLQETLNNGSKHAHGARQTVAIARASDGIEVQVCDDGPGFAPPEGGEGLGLLGLRERVAGLKGCFDLHSRQGGGTRVVMRLPEDKEAIT
jgi:signal transduction histidine kinase